MQKLEATSLGVLLYCRISDPISRLIQPRNFAKLLLCPLDLVVTFCAYIIPYV